MAIAHSSEQDNIFAKSLQQFAANMIAAEVNKLVEAAKLEIEKKIKAEADRMCLNVLSHYSVVSNAKELIITVRKD